MMNYRIIFYFAVRLMWSSLFCALLAFAWVQREIHDMPVAATLFAAVLSLPAGPLAIMVVGVFYGETIQRFAIPYESFRDFLPLWAASAAVAYFQWFVIFPGFLRWLRGRLKARANG
ncbi:hypothetical protein GT347_21890 [Xylophilus rhododendri]|uniref:Transmembrane protein n=1 Tax=Xylophilus rhododendri TaxID=2697032 RepID=A0A857JCJ1_9BURK|nr:hypothetical protein [Xylophilus rhododendri]QHJ00396.1 hypothetical protein GT347_21890 [Xylophilus rhododendri]